MTSDVNAGAAAKGLPRRDDFSDWYSEILWRAEIVDTRYPVKGVCVWQPFGFKMRNLIYSILRSLLDDSGHEEVLFPLLIPRSELMKEEEHIKGFEGEVFWVTRGGYEELDVPLALRPTSETAIYPMLNLWIRSHRDLPIRIYQVVNVFRYETKHTRPLIRVREITSFKEAHTAHASREDAEEQVHVAVEIYKRFFDRLAVPYIVTERPEWDKFPGAERTIAFDTLMPDGRTMQIATIHMLGDKFARTFDITFEDCDGNRKFVQQTCYGISERCVAAVIAVHGDDHGLVLPPEVAPVQVVIVPIVFSRDEMRDDVLSVCSELRDALDDANIRVVLDDSDERPGAKFYKWEMKGVPLRIEVGPRDLKTGKCVFVTRHDLNKFHVNLSTEEVVGMVRKTLARIYEEMKANAWRRFNDMIISLSASAETTAASSAESDISDASSDTSASDEDVLSLIGAKMRGGIVNVFMCPKCGKALKELTGASVLGTPFDGRKKGKCVVCSQECAELYVARTY